MKVIFCILILVTYDLINANQAHARSALNGTQGASYGANQALAEITQKNRNLWPKQYDLSIFEAFDQHATNLKSINTADLKSWCPKLDSTDNNAKKLFLSELMFKLAQYESNYKPGTTFSESFKNGRGETTISTGLMQISYESSNHFGCAKVNGGIPVTTSSLKDPILNLKCSVLILDRLIGNSGQIAGRGSGQGCYQGWCGGSAYWSPLRKADKTEIIKNFSRNSLVCNGGAQAKLASLKTSNVRIAQEDTTKKTQFKKESLEINEHISGNIKQPDDLFSIDTLETEMADEHQMTGASLN